MGQRSRGDKVNVLVIGGGPAGLAAAERLLDDGGAERFQVRHATLGHHYGGKADSWRDRQGRLIDHGQHVIPGFYYEMKAMLARAGIDVDARLVDNEGHTYIYEPRDDRVHDFALTRNPFHQLYRALAYPGLTGGEKANATAFVTANSAAFVGLQDLEQFDDICFTAWCVSNGMDASTAQTSAFRMSRTGQLNWPGEISAYSMLQSIRVIGRDFRTSSYAFCDGGMSERFWEPLVGHLGSLGCTFEMMRKLTALRRRGARLEAVVFDEPDPAGHDTPHHPPSRSAFEHLAPSKPGTRKVDDDFDFAICAIPAPAFNALNPGDDDFWSIPELGRIRNIRGIAPLALQIWHREQLTRRYESVIAGLEGPLGFVLDNKKIIREYREDPRYGAVLYFVGQETGYENWTDEEHLEICLENLTRLPGFERMTREGILHYQVIRNRSVDKQYFNAEPGIQRFRPGSPTPFDNLFFAGDWVRTDIDFPCMEAAVRSGRAAAEAVIERSS